MCAGASARPLTIVDPASEPLQPSWPRPKIILPIGVLLPVLLGALVAEACLDAETLAAWMDDGLDPAAVAQAEAGGSLDGPIFSKLRLEIGDRRLVISSLRSPVSH